jgi:serine/threonine protein kinase
MSPTTPEPSGHRRVIGRYEILKRIGAGGMGAVYLARHLDLQREVALKILPLDLASQPEMLERFRREAQHAAKLRNEHIVTLYEFGEVQGTHFLAMEYVDGINLHEYIRQKSKLNPDEARKLLIQAARALALAHRQGIVHRDIKPSNFLLTKKDGQPFVKLTDFGLARATNDDQFKVTQTGQTIGTVDYIAPEQARNSRSADARSDIYSLGCTFFHMLAGRPPFSEGDLTERLLKHLEQPTPDVRRLNPHVSEGLVAVLNRMMAKKPDERYQSADELLRDLEKAPTTATLNPRELLEALALDSSEKKKPTSPSASDSAKSKLNPSSSARATARPVPPAKLRYRKGRDGPKASAGGTGFQPRDLMHGWVPGLILGLILLVVGGIAVAIASGWWKDSAIPIAEAAPSDRQPTLRSGEKNRQPADTDSQADRNAADSASASPLPRIYQPAASELTEMRKTFAEDTNAGQPKPTNDADPVFVVSRLPAPGLTHHFASLHDACAAAPPGKETVIEIRDNGPLFERNLGAADRSLVIRAGEGFRPLIVWNLHSPSYNDVIVREALLTLAKGDVTLKDLDFVVKIPEGKQLGAFIRFQEGIVRLEGCTFSVAGALSGDLAGIQFMETHAPVTPPVCRMNRCYFRGAELCAFDVGAAGAELTVDNCVLVTGNRPLFHFRVSSGETPIVVRAAHSTLVAGETLFRFRERSSGDNAALHLVLWDSVLARSGSQEHGVFMDLGERADTAGLKFQALNCLYAGWQTLLKSAGREIGNRERAAWRALWNHPAADEVSEYSWPAFVPELAEASPAVFRVAGTPVGYPASAGTGLLGCDIHALPAIRSSWLSITEDRFVAPPFEPASTERPEIPVSSDGSYAGGSLKLNGVDLGDYLRTLQKTGKLAPRVVLHLSGKREVPTAPIHLKGSSLVLYFEPAANESERLVLVPKDAESCDSLIEVEDGSCEVINGAIRFPSGKASALPAHVITVQGGDLRLTGCRLHGPVGVASDAYRGLISFARGESSAGRRYECAVAESVLISGKAGLHIVGAGLRMQNSAVIAGTEAIRLDPIASAATDGIPCILERNTVAAGTTVFALSEIGALPGPVQPFLVQARRNIFVTPLRADSQAGRILLVDEEALSRGRMIWQGDDNVYPAKLSVYASRRETPPPDKPESFAAWARLWGPPGERSPGFADFTVQLDLQAPKWAGLVLPPSLRSKTGGMPRGADLEQLGLVKKPAKSQ